MLLFTPKSMPMHRTLTLVAQNPRSDIIEPPGKQQIMTQSLGLCHLHGEVGLTASLLASA